jgi:hypothetical protein
MEPKEFERAARLPPAVAGLAGRQRGGACCNSSPAYDCALCRMTRLPCIVTDMSLVLRLALQLCTADGASSTSSNSASRSVISGSRGDAFARKNRASSMYALACAESMRVKLAACSADSGSLSCSSCSWKRPILRARLAVMTESPISRHASRWIDAMRGVSMPSVKESNVPAERQALSCLLVGCTYGCRLYGCRLARNKSLWSFSFSLYYTVVGKMPWAWGSAESAMRLPCKIIVGGSPPHMHAHGCTLLLDMHDVHQIRLAKASAMR